MDGVTNDLAQSLSVMGQIPRSWEGTIKNKKQFRKITHQKRFSANGV